MTVLVDTSAFLAILDTSDIEHQNASVTWQGLISEIEILVCHNYILVETLALVQRRLGMEAVQVLQEDVFPLLDIKWITQEIHQVGVAAMLLASRRKLSLVDCVSFEVMRQRGITTAFCFDKHFTEHGFTCLPAEVDSV